MDKTYQRDKKSTNEISVSFIEGRVLERIKTTRLSNGVTHDVIASKLDITTEGYIEIEDGVTPLSIIWMVKIAGVLSVTIADLLCLKDGLSTQEKRIIDELEEDIVELKNALKEKTMLIDLLKDKVEGKRRKKVQKHISKAVAEN
ncbi:hypothetical protein EYV94_26100 [Puteibacter caeruleilacunae]|nr:hypothetical protein EYV94_26100 [Puteibacter caeruleilacunae]